ncbi:MAG: hypothetical protein J6S40_04780 [Thermoguttaceae bacterium]|nr:hypothetical protein [Thermoguttaceae bacterium]
MKLKQISLFLENRPGHLSSACRKLADAGLNVEAMALADTENYGILRFLVKDWQKSVEICEQLGLVAKVTEVLAVSVSNTPGGLADLLAILAKTSVNIEYMYGFNFHPSGRAVIVLRIDKPDEALDALKDSKVEILTEENLFS